MHVNDRFSGASAASSADAEDDGGNVQVLDAVATDANAIKVAGHCMNLMLRCTGGYILEIEDPPSL
jgi:hypothetical protein